MGALGNTLPSVIAAGPGGYTYPLSNPVIMLLAPRVDDELCTAQEGHDFATAVIGQGDVIPRGQPVYVRQLTKSELNADVALVAMGYLPLVLEFAGPVPGKNFVSKVPAQSSVVVSPQFPAFFSINIGLMLASAPSITPGGPQGYNRNFKIQVKAGGSFSWVGLDQPTWQGDVTTAS